MSISSKVDILRLGGRCDLINRLYNIEPEMLVANWPPFIRRIEILINEFML